MLRVGNHPQQSPLPAALEHNYSPFPDKASHPQGEWNGSDWLKLMKIHPRAGEGT